jgi:hypothetical protein
MDELHNVSAQNPTNGQTLIYNETTSLWQKANLTAGSNVSITNAAGSITIAATGDVVGPSLSVDNELVLFDSTTGKLIKRATLTGLVKATSGVASAATAGTDYLTPPSGTSLLKANSGGALANAVSGTDYAPATSGTSVLKGNGSGGFSNATSGTDYAPATSGTSILYGNGSGGFSNVTVGSGLTFTTGTLSATGGGGSTSIGLVRAIAINCILC